MNYINGKFRTSLDTAAALLLTLSASVVSPAFGEGNSHYEAYQKSLILLEDGQSNILEQMYNIQSGEVAHFDFLQNEHIEVIRHARALRYPPSELNTDQRNALSEQADKVLSQADALEWPIADFLRGHALLDSALSNTIDIARQASIDSDKLTRVSLQNLINGAQHFRLDPAAAELPRLMAAFDAIMSATPQEESPWRKELEIQKTLLIKGVQESTTALATVEAAGIAIEAGTLRGIFTASRRAD